MHGPTCICWANLTPFSLKTAAAIGFVFAAAAGGLISAGIFLLREPLAHFYTEAEDVADLAVEASPWVCLYYLINSVTWGAWAIMQGQMRTCFPATVICVGMWAVSVPLAYFAVTYKLDETFHTSPLVILWGSCCIGEGASCALMFSAIVRSNGAAIAEEAIESATIGEEDEGEGFDYDDDGNALAKTKSALRREHAAGNKAAGRIVDS